MYAHTVGSQRYHFRDLRTLLAKATPARSGDALAGLAGLAAESAEERVAAQMVLSERSRPARIRVSISRPARREPMLSPAVFTPSW
jgi:ethanolamine ammonia-lyase large subunit